MVNRSSKAKLRSAAAELGRLGGLKGGKARAAKLSAEERRDIARQGAIKRWSGAKKRSPDESRTDFDIQKALFQKIPAARLAKYKDHYVVSQNGRIVDSDIDLPTLTKRFFKNRPRKSVYITCISGDAAVIGSPVRA